MPVRSPLALNRVGAALSFRPLYQVFLQAAANQSRGQEGLWKEGSALDSTQSPVCQHLQEWKSLQLYHCVKRKMVVRYPHRPIFVESCQHDAWRGQRFR